MSVVTFLKEKGIPFRENVPLCTVSSMRVGGIAPLIIEPSSAQALVCVLHELLRTGIPYGVVGAMTNTLPPDATLTYPLLSTTSMKRICMTDGFLEAEAGARIGAIFRQGLRVGVDALSTLATVPGTIGGAVYGNAGVFGHEIGEYVSEVRVFDPSDGEEKTYDGCDMAFSYRSCRLKGTDAVILSVKLCTTKRTVSDVEREVRAAADKRRMTQPTEPSLGCIFLRTEQGISAAKLIDACGLKGLRIGDAYISPRHAGFIVNGGTARASDVQALIYYIKQRIFEAYGVSLTCEISVLPKER